MRKIAIDGPYITLGQLLKRIDLISSGGEAKHFLKDIKVLVNNSCVTERGRKIYPNDVIKIDNFGVMKVLRGGSSDAS